MKYVSSLAILIASLCAATPAWAQEDVSAPEPEEGDVAEPEAQPLVEEATDVAPVEEAAPEEEEDPPHIVEAQERIGQGNSLLGEGDYDAALAEFEAAYELVGDHPIRFQLLYNIGKAHELRFRYDLAIEYYERFLSEGGAETELRVEVETTLRTLSGLLATLVVRSNVPAEVWVGDRHVGDAPGNVLVPGGVHMVELRAEGYTDAREEVQIAPRDEQELSFELDELAEEYTGISPAFFWASTGVAIASAVVGSIFGIVAVVERNSLESTLADPVDRYDADLVDEHRQSIDDLALTADIFFGTALLFGATAFVLALFTDWGGEDEAGEADATAARIDLRPAFSDTAAGVVVGGAF